MQRTEINQEIVDRLCRDYGMKNRGSYLRQGKCPECSKKELFISKQEPHYLKCGRENHCGWGIKTRELYTDLFKPLHELHPPTRQSPHATARAYLKARALNPSLFQGEFIQAQRFEREALREPRVTETVKFFLSHNQRITWERYITPIEMPDKVKKAHFVGSYKGLWWKPKAFLPTSGERIFLVEGIFDALSLIQSGFQAVALMSCYNWPERSLKPYLGKGIRWVVALDNDKAGLRYNQMFYRKLKKLQESADICVAPSKEKRDFNDLLKASGQITSDSLKPWFQAGDLLTANSAKQKALKLVAQMAYPRTWFTFDFNNELCVAKYNETEDEDPIQVMRIANCKPEFLYFQKDTISDESSYYMRVIRPQSDTAYNSVFSPSQLASAKEFKQRLLNVGAGLMFTGTTKQLEQYQQEHWFNESDLPEVETVNFLGYVKEWKGWVFPKHAIFDGVFYRSNQDDFFDLPNHKRVKTTFRQDSITLGKPDEAHNPALWLDHYRRAFGTKGFAVLAFWVGSFFAEQIRHGKAVNQASYPFLELSGEPGTGKSTLLEFLWKLTGRENYEGIELAKATPATRWRSLGQLANLPLVMIEGDRSENGGHQRSTFDLNEIKPLYNGRGMRGTAHKNNGNETKEPPFRGSVIVAQNARVDSERAVMERIVQVYWDKSHFSREGYEAAKRLRTVDMNDINGFMAACVLQEHRFLKAYKTAYANAMDGLEADDELNNQRLRHNHAQIIAVLVALKRTGILATLSDDDLKNTSEYLHSCCVERHQCLDTDTPLVAEFWEQYHFLQDSGLRVNHAPENSGVIRINLNHFTLQAAEGKQRPLDLAQLRKELRTSKQYRFIEYKNAYSQISNKSPKCFVFSVSDNVSADAA